MKSFKLILNINYNVINYIFNFFAFSIIDVTLLRLALYHLYTVLCGVEGRAPVCRTMFWVRIPLNLQNFIFKLCCQELKFNIRK